MDDLELIQAFVQAFIQGESLLLANANLRAESAFKRLQLFSAKPEEGLLALATVTDNPRSIRVKKYSSYWQPLLQALAESSFFAIAPAPEVGFWRFEYCAIPEGYRVNSAPAIDLWRMWRQVSRNNLDQASSGPVSIFHQGSWRVVKDLLCSQGSVYLKLENLSEEVGMSNSELVFWLELVS